MEIFGYFVELSTGHDFEFPLKPAEFCEFHGITWYIMEKSGWTSDRNDESDFPCDENVRYLFFISYVIPAKAGIHHVCLARGTCFAKLFAYINGRRWAPAFAGVTGFEEVPDGL
jgi:hypothetical protein